MKNPIRTRLCVAACLAALPAIAGAQEAYAIKTVNLRAGPDRTYPLVAQIGAGAPLEVFGCLDDWTWCDVAFGGARGWVYAPNLSYAYQGDRVPLYAYGPSFGIPVLTFTLGAYWDDHYRERPWYGGRQQWEQRAPPVHQRPPGPAPRATPPPRAASRPGAGIAPAGQRAVPPAGARQEAPRGPAPRGAEARPAETRAVAPVPAMAAHREAPPQPAARPQGAAQPNRAPPQAAARREEPQGKSGSAPGGQDRGERGEQRGRD